MVSDRITFYWFPRVRNKIMNYFDQTRLHEIIALFLRTHSNFLC